MVTAALAAASLGSLALPAGSSLVTADAYPAEGARLRLEDEEGSWAEIALSSSDGVWRAQVRGQKEGRPLPPQESWSQILDGRYSMPFRTPSGRLRAFCDRVGKVIRMAWGFREKIHGEEKEGWIELAPMPDHLAEKARATASGPLTLQSIPARDQDDRKTGFRVTQRPFHWSGAYGSAWVVTFDDACPWSKKDIKLVFWSEASYTPNWMMSPSALQGFEFLETWGGGGRGCYEPMSDRVNRFARVQVLEDTPARKVVRWSYALLNPDYEIWGAAKGSKQMAEAQEDWTIYPDGTVYRTQRYFPSLDTPEPQHGLGVQVAEADVVFASNVLPEEVLPRQALTAFGPGGARSRAWFPRGQEAPEPKVSEWSRFGLAIHYLDRSLPDPFIAFSPSRRLDSSLDDDRTWHEERFWRFSHFPFNHEPFQYETNSQTEGRGVISHTCLSYAGDSGGREWVEGFQVDSRGRKYREYRSLLGFEPKGSLDRMARRHGDCVEGSRWASRVKGGRGLWHEGRGELEVASQASSFSLSEGPGARPSVFWKGSGKVEAIRLGSRRLTEGRDYRLGSLPGGTLVWLSPALPRGPLRLTRE